MKYKGIIFLLMMMLIFCVGADFLSNKNRLVINNLSLESRKAARRELLGRLIVKYENNQIFNKVYAHMKLKFESLHKTTKPRSPELVIQETFDKTRLLFERTKPYIGNSFSRIYDPAQIEKNVQKYLWLKEVCFLVLGINDEHRVALSYFYLPGNENEKQELLTDVVHYSFPEIPDVPANQIWQSEMRAVMDRLGYRIFNIKNLVP